MGGDMRPINRNSNNFKHNTMNIQDESLHHVSKKKDLKALALNRMSEIREQIRDLHSEEANIETILMDLSE